MPITRKFEATLTEHTSGLRLILKNQNFTESVQEFENLTFQLRLLLFKKKFKKMSNSVGFQPGTPKESD